MDDMTRLRELGQALYAADPGPGTGLRARLTDPDGGAGVFAVPARPPVPRGPGRHGRRWPAPVAAALLVAAVAGSATGLLRAEESPARPVAAPVGGQLPPAPRPGRARLLAAARAGVRTPENAPPSTAFVYVRSRT